MLTGPLLDAALAAAANRLWGTALAPWEIGDLDEAAIDLIRAVAERAPRLEKNVKKIEQTKADYWAAFERRRH